MQKSELKNHHENAINFVEIDTDKVVFTCSDSSIIGYNLSTSSKDFLFKSSSKNDEFTCLKLINEHLFAAQENILLVFDVQNSKQIDKFKFFKETINSIEINNSKNLKAQSLHLIPFACYKLIIKI